MTPIETVLFCVFLISCTKINDDLPTLQHT